MYNRWIRFRVPRFYFSLVDCFDCEAGVADLFLIAFVLTNILDLYVRCFI